MLESRGAARAALSQLQEAASDLRAALKLRPAHPSVLASLDEIARRAVAEGVDLQPLPLAPPASPEPAIAPAAQPQGKEAAVVEARAEATESGSTGESAASSSAKEPKVVSAGVPPPVGTRSAALLKGDADGAVRNGKLEQALQLYGVALQVRAQNTLRAPAVPIHNDCLSRRMLQQSGCRALRRVGSCSAANASPTALLVTCD